MNKKKKWEILEKKDISPSRWFPLYVHKVKLPNGKIIDDFFVSDLGAVAMIVAITKKRELVLAKQYKHGIRKIILELPAGRVGKRTPEQTAKQELREETGIIANKLIPLGKVCPAPTKDSTWAHGFLITEAEIETKQKLDPTEDIEIVLVPLNQVDEKIKSGAIAGSDSVAIITLAKLNYPDLFK